MSDNNGFLDVRWHFSGNVPEPILFFSKYIQICESAHGDNNLINASIILKKGRVWYSTFRNKLGITKYSIVTNSNDSVTLRLMTEHDLAMLYEWLNRSHIVEWWGGEETPDTCWTYRNSTCQAF